MTVSVIVAVIFYFMIGLIIGVALVGDSDEVGLLVLFWPITVVCLLVFGIANLCYKIGIWLHEYVVEKFN